MFERLKQLYIDGRIDIDGLLKAVEKGWITEAQFYAITGEQIPVINRKKEKEESGRE